MPEIKTLKPPEKKDQADLEKFLKEVAPEGTQLVLSDMFPNEWYILDREAHKLALINAELGYVSMIRTDEVPKWVVKLTEKIEEQKNHEITYTIFLH